MRKRSFVPAQAEGSFSMPVASGLKVMDGFLVPVLLGFFQVGYTVSHALKPQME